MCYKFDRITQLDAFRQLIISKVPKEIDSYSIEVFDSVVKRYSVKKMDELVIGHIPVQYVQVTYFI